MARRSAPSTLGFRLISQSPRLSGAHNRNLRRAARLSGPPRQRASTATTDAGFLAPLNALFTESGSTLATLPEKQALHSAGLLHQADAAPFRLSAGSGEDGTVLKSGFMEETLRAGDSVIIVGRTQSLPTALRAEVDREELW